MTPAVRFAVLYAGRPAGMWSELAVQLDRTEYTRETLLARLDRIGVDNGHPLRDWVRQERWPGDLWCVDRLPVDQVEAVVCLAPTSDVVPRLEPAVKTADGFVPPGAGSAPALNPVPLPLADRVQTTLGTVTPLATDRLVTLPNESR